MKITREEAQKIAELYHGADPHPMNVDDMLRAVNSTLAARCDLAELTPMEEQFVEYARATIHCDRSLAPSFAHELVQLIRKRFPKKEQPADQLRTIVREMFELPNHGRAHEWAHRIEEALKRIS